MDINKIVSSLAGSGVLGGLAGGALGGALVGNKKARKTAGTVLKVGGVAALGGLAWKAYQNYQNAEQPMAQANAQQPAAAASIANWQGLTEQNFALDDQNDSAGSPALLIVDAMVAAACADGHLDQEERGNILDKVGDLSLSAEEKALVFDTLQSPPSLTDLVARVDSPEVATEVYLSSLLVIDTSRPEARMYLDALAFRLGLPPGLAAQMEAGIERGI